MSGFKYGAIASKTRRIGYFYIGVFKLRSPGMLTLRSEHSTGLDIFVSVVSDLL